MKSGAVPPAGTAVILYYSTIFQNTQVFQGISELASSIWGHLYILPYLSAETSFILSKLRPNFVKFVKLMFFHRKQLTNPEKCCIVSALIVS